MVNVIVCICACNRRRCEVCQAAEFKYKCPRCMTKSCSLPCVKQHKLTSGCNGQRDKTAFIPLNDFTDLDLLSGRFNHLSSFVFFLLFVKYDTIGYHVVLTCS